MAKTEKRHRNGVNALNDITVSMPLFCLSHNFVYLLYLDIIKINKQGCGLAKKGHENMII